MIKTKIEINNIDIYYTITLKCISVVIVKICIT